MPQPPGGRRRDDRPASRSYCRAEKDRVYAHSRGCDAPRPHSSHSDERRSFRNHVLLDSETVYLGKCHFVGIWQVQSHLLESFALYLHAAVSFRPTWKEIYFRDDVGKPVANQKAVFLVYLPRARLIHTKNMKINADTHLSLSAFNNKQRKGAGIQQLPFSFDTFASQAAATTSAFLIR